MEQNTHIYDEAVDAETYDKQAHKCYIQQTLGNVCIPHDTARVTY